MQVDTVANNKLHELIDQKFPQAVLNNNGQRDVYTSVKEEYDSLKKGVAIHDVSYYGMLKISGKDSLDFLHRISTNSVKDLEPFQKTATLFINEKGRFIDRTTLLKFDNDLLMIGSSQPVGKLKLWLSRYIVTEDVNIEVVNDRWTLFEILGPQANSYLTLICGDTLNELSENNVVTVDVESLKFFLFKKIEPTGLVRYWMLSYSVIADKLMEFLLDQKSVFDLSLVGEEAFNIFRIEMGLPKAPNEINDSFNPHETNLTSEICFNKGCYIGQEVIARLDAYDKVQKNLIGVIFDKEIPVANEIKVFDDKENEIGLITSTAKSVLLDKMIGLAYIRKTHLGNGTQFIAVADNERSKISVTNLPFTK